MDNVVLQLWWGLWPGIVAGLVAAGALVYFVWGPPGGRIDLAGRSGSVLLPDVLVHFGYWLARPVVDGLARRGVRPNHVTLTSVAVAGGAAVLFAAGAMMAAGWVLAAAAFCDMFDGLLARRRETATPDGAFLDSFADRVTEGLVLGGLAVWGGGRVLSWLCVAALLASLLVSYARARGQSLGVDPKIGVMQRPERLVVLFVTVFAAPVAGAIAGSGAVQYYVAVAGIGLLAVLSAGTAVTRARWAVRVLGAPAEAVASSGEDIDSRSSARGPTAEGTGQ